MSNVKEEIQKAIGAHGVWKMRLASAIQTGKVDAEVDTIRVDNKCAFGQWLYGPGVPPAEKTGDHFKKVRDLRAEFHKTAARVAELAIAGKKDDAKRLMDTGAYKEISTNLTAAMMNWSNTVK
ncbi:MAG: CZB domain-containing protein [Nitrospinae bacterium]|nr:CZB domain-containing protein [Nitrospinota bacterium]